MRAQIRKSWKEALPQSLERIIPESTLEPAYKVHGYIGSFGIYVRPILGWSHPIFINYTLNGSRTSPGYGKTDRMAGTGGRVPVSPFPGDILEPFRVLTYNPLSPLLIWSIFLGQNVTF